MLIVPNEGLKRMLERGLRGFLGGVHDLAIRLYKNDYIPTSTSVLSNFVESTFQGYYRQWGDSSQWLPATMSGGRATSTYGSVPLTWTCTGGDEKIFGYYVEESETATVLWCERLSVPRTLVPGTVIDLTLTLMGQSAL